MNIALALSQYPEAKELMTIHKKQEQAITSLASFFKNTNQSSPSYNSLQLTKLAQKIRESHEYFSELNEKTIRIKNTMLQQGYDIYERLPLERNSYIYLITRIQIVTSMALKALSFFNINLSAAQKALKIFHDTHDIVDSIPKVPLPYSVYEIAMTYLRGENIVKGRNKGKGACGSVYMVDSPYFTCPLVKKNAKIIQITENEAPILHTIQHPFITGFRGVESTNEIYLEQLDSLIQKKGSIPSIFYTKRAKFCLQILYALKYLHKRKIVHADLKLENILLKGDNLVKLCDFGLSFVFINPWKNYKLRGSPYYIPPESKNSPKGDIWALGILLYMLHSKDHKYFESTLNTIQKLGIFLSNLTQSYIDDKIEALQNINAEEKALIKLMLQVDPIHRLSAEDLIENPYFDPVREQVQAMLDHPY